MTTHTAPANLARILGPEEDDDDATDLAEASARAAIRDQQRADAAARRFERAACLLLTTLATEVRASRDALRAASAPGVDPLVLARAQGAHDALASLADTVCCPSCGAPIGAELPCDDCP